MIRRRKSERDAPDATELRLQSRLANLDALRPREEKAGESARLRWPGAPPLASKTPADDPDPAELEAEYAPEDVAQDIPRTGAIPLSHESNVDGNVRESLEVVAEDDMEVEAELVSAIGGPLVEAEVVGPVVKAEAVEAEAVAVEVGSDMGQEIDRAPLSGDGRWDALLAPAAVARSPLMDAISRGAASAGPTVPPESAAVGPAETHWVPKPRVALEPTAAQAIAESTPDQRGPLPSSVEAFVPAIGGEAGPPIHLDGRWNPRPLAPQDEVPPAAEWQPAPAPETPLSTEAEAAAASEHTRDPHAPIPIDARRFFRPQAVAAMSAAMSAEPRSDTSYDTSPPEPRQSPATEPLSMQPEQPDQPDPSRSTEPTPLRPPAPWARSATPTPPSDASNRRPSERQQASASGAKPEARDSSTMSPEELEREFKAALAKFSKS